MPPRRRRSVLPPIEEGDEVQIGVCIGCGELTHVVIAMGPPRLMRITNHRQSVDGFAGPFETAHCLVCGTLGAGLAYPRNQDLLQASLLVGGWEAVTPAMIAEPKLRACYRSGLTSQGAIRDAARTTPKRRWR